MPFIKASRFEFPSPPLPRKMPWLNGAMGLSSATQRSGMCFHRSAAFVLDVPGSRLCMGVFRAANEEERRAIGPAASAVPFIHCWAEFSNGVWAPTLIENNGGRLLPLPREVYLEHNGASDVREYRRRDLLRLAQASGFRKHLIYHWPLPGGASFGTTLLNAAWGTDWEVTPQGGIVPSKGE